MASTSSHFNRVVRRLARAPFFTLVAVITLALGIGANVAIFSVVNGVLLKPLPFNEPDRLVGVWHSAPGLDIPLLNQGPATYLTYREENQTFDEIGLWNGAAVSITGIGEPERVQALLVTDGTLGVLRVEPILGRRFSAQDDSAGAPDTVLLTHAYWQRKFGGDRSAVGRIMTIESKPHEVIGVLPQSFRFLNRDPQVLLPFKFDRAKLFVGNFSYRGVGRLKPGVTIEQANADIARMLPMTIERFPLPPGFTRQMFDQARIGPRVRPFEQDAVGDIGQMLWILLGTVAFVLLIACANVANLFLVRAEARQQELAIHAALGASWRRIVWELLSESLTLAALGGLAGLGLAFVALQVLRSVAPEGLPRLNEIAIDPIVLLFTIAISTLAGLLFGIIPVIKFARPQLANALKEGGRLSSAGRARHRARNALVVAEIALAVVLLIASGLMIRTFQAMQRVHPGFSNPHEVLTLRVSIPETLVKDEEQTARMHFEIAQRIRQVPGVTSVGLASSITMDGNDSNDPIFVEDFPVPEGTIPTMRRYKWIGEGYFETMGNPVLAGRPIEWRDLEQRTDAVMVSENFAREYWKDPNKAIGRRIRPSPSAPWRTIVGVVGDERDDGVTKPTPSIIYWPMLVDKLWTADTLIYRTMGYAIRNQRQQSPTLLKEIQQAVWSVNPNLPLANVQTLEEIQAETMAQTSFALVMLSIAAGVALLLGIVGIYGVISYIATQRTREIGIRMALGAAQKDVSALFLRHGLLLSGIGIVLGIAGAAGLTQLMSAMLFGVQPLDGVTYLAVAVLLGVTALLATYLPAARASRVDPSVALRFEV